MFSVPWSDPQPHHRVRRRLAAVGTALIAAVAIVSPVAAAAQTLTVDRTITAGPTSLGGLTYVVSGVVSGTITVSADVTFTQPVRETLAFDDASLRQGSTLPVNRTVATNGAGNLHVVWHVDNTLPLIAGTFDTSKDVSCTLDFSAPVTCDATSSGFSLTPDGTLTPGAPYADLVLQASVKVTPTGATVDSTELAGTVAIGGPSSQSEPGTQSVQIPCTVGKGDSLSLSDQDYDFATGVDSTNGPAIKIGFWLPNPITVVPAFKGPGVDLDLGPQHAASFTEHINDGSTKDTVLGAIAPNNVPPGADAGGPYDTLEGVPTQFDGTGSSSVCGFDNLALRWDFSDGGVAFGGQPFHTFQDNGVFSGLLTATDPTGLSNSVAFSVTVLNQDPIANAGPDTSSDWGRLVAFNGQATDPGAGDQPTLQYSWDFGDGTPSASGSASVLHAYAAPGDYVANLTVTDKDGGIDHDTRTVHVTKRDTTTAMANAAGTFDTPGQLNASLVDEYGVSLNAEPMTFTVDGAPAGSASTNSSGIATLVYVPEIDAGSHATNASFGGDALYNASSDGGSITVAKKATTVAYTGALSGGPNKTVTLSATLTDATGARLAGRTIDFQLGSQSISAVTDLNGVATVSLKLNQKNGTYPLAATWSPSGTDANRYVGNTASASFKLQSK